MNPRQPDLDGLDQEIRDHIDAETQDNIARGMTEGEARFAALRKFGNPTRVKEDVRGVWVPRWADQLRQDLRDAVRSIKRQPAFASLVILTLAIGIGLTTAVYSVLIGGLLYGVEATDVPTFAIATVTLAVIALLACCVPALKAALVDPVIALRAE